MLRQLLKRLRQIGRDGYLRRHGIDHSGGVVLYGFPRIRLCPGSTVSFGRSVSLNSRWSSNDLDAPGRCVIRTLADNAIVEVGDYSGFTSVTLSAAKHIRVGKRTLVGAGTIITDSDHHYVDLNNVAERRYAGRPKPQESDAVNIGDDVFIGARSIILKGTSIGSGSVIGAGSVVSGTVPAGVIFGGNPAKFIRNLRTPEVDVV